MEQIQEPDQEAISFNQSKERSVDHMAVARMEVSSICLGLHY